MSEEDFAILSKNLKRLDYSGSIKDWTLKILAVVDQNPERRAIDYANQLGYEKEWFKLNIRKLKNLGLTISLENGYTISTRGKAFLRRKQA